MSKISTAPLIFMLGCTFWGLREGYRQDAAIEVLRSAAKGEIKNIVSSGVTLSACGVPDTSNERVCVAINERGEIFGNGENPFSHRPCEKGGGSFALDLKGIDCRTALSLYDQLQTAHSEQFRKHQE